MVFLLKQQKELPGCPETKSLFYKSLYEEMFYLCYHRLDAVWMYLVKQLQ